MAKQTFRTGPLAPAKFFMNGRDFDGVASELVPPLDVLGMPISRVFFGSVSGISYKSIVFEVPEGTAKPGDAVRPTACEVLSDDGTQIFQCTLNVFEGGSPKRFYAVWKGDANTNQGDGLINEGDYIVVTMRNNAPDPIEARVDTAGVLGLSPEPYPVLNQKFAKVDISGLLDLSPELYPERKNRGFVDLSGLLTLSETNYTSVIEPRSVDLLGVNTMGPQAYEKVYKKAKVDVSGLSILQGDYYPIVGKVAALVDIVGVLELTRIEGLYVDGLETSVHTNGPTDSRLKVDAVETSMMYETLGNLNLKVDGLEIQVMYGSPSAVTKRRRPPVISWLKRS